MVNINSLAEACWKVLAFIGDRKIGATDYGDVCGRVERDGVPYCRVSYHARRWALDEQGHETYRAMSLSGEVAP